MRLEAYEKLAHRIIVHVNINESECFDIQILHHGVCFVWLCVCMCAEMAHSVPDARTWMHSSVTTKLAQCSYVFGHKNCCMLCTWCTRLNDYTCSANVMHNRYACTLLE